MSTNTYEALNAKSRKTVVFKNGSSFYSIWSYIIFASTVATRAATEEEIKNPFPGSKIVKNNLYSMFCWLWCYCRSSKWCVGKTRGSTRSSSITWRALL